MRRTLMAASAAVMVMAAGRVEAQMPTVQQVYDKFATAVGGRAAWEKITGRTEKGTADITFANLSGAYERHSALPNKMRMIIDLGVARIDQGFDGTKGWADQGGGPQPMAPDQEKSLAEPQANGAAFLDPTRYTKSEVVGKEAFDGQESYKVTFTNKAGITATEYFSVATGLRVGQIATTPMGEQKIIYKEYKEFEGKKIPSKVVQVTPQGDVVINVTSVTFGAPPDATFKSPIG